MAAGWLAVHRIDTGGGPEADNGELAVEPAGAHTLTLPEGKLKAAGFESLAAQSQAVQHLHTVPGRIRYDESKHVEVKAPMDGILSEVLVTPGDHVESGQLLAVIRSPEIGQARGEILKRQKESEIARQVLDRERMLSRNLETLSGLLEQRESIEAIETALAGESLGSYRQELLSAYAKMLLTDDLLEKVKPLGETGSIAGRTIRERKAERAIAAAEFAGAHDQAVFAAQQARSKAEAQLAEAARQLDLAWESLETLLGYEQDRDCVDLSDPQSLSRLEVRAPFTGSVESRAFASDERVARGDSLIVLANTDSLYVSASIRESDWPAVTLKPGTRIQVTVPALQDRTFAAILHYVGREVGMETNSIPLVATLNNGEQLLRPGMFVRVAIPIGDARQALSVKPESVIQHENQQFVFVDMSGGTFKRVDVSTGLASEDWVEVTKGLSPGQLVVTHGAFLLKSELLLQGEGE